MTRRLKASTPGHRNPTLTEEQLAAELGRRAEQERSAAIAVCCHAIRAGWHRDDAVEVIRIVIDRDTLAAWGMEPDPVPSAKGKYAWGSAKGAKAG